MVVAWKNVVGPPPITLKNHGENRAPKELIGNKLSLGDAVFFQLFRVVSVSGDYGKPRFFLQ